MTEALHRGDEAEVERVARVIRECAHAALAENHVVISLAHYVFRSHQKFFERSRHPAFQENGQLRSACAAQKREVLHVASANLDAIGVLAHGIE